MGWVESETCRFNAENEQISRVTCNIVLTYVKEQLESLVARVGRVGIGHCTRAGDFAGQAAFSPDRCPGHIGTASGLCSADSGVRLAALALVAQPSAGTGSAGFRHGAGRHESDVLHGAARYSVWPGRGHRVFRAAGRGHLLLTPRTGLCLAGAGGCRPGTDSSSGRQCFGP
ncbi:hypothetical protein SDC9_167881 [bioreactor metagenome]|uniref:Uncharacterized protein n=1 Tax=bioreactor metagenome TaxID=1076179 RepID=A0A645G3H8_9ZZZZ